MLSWLIFYKGRVLGEDATIKKVSLISVNMAESQGLLGPRELTKQINQILL